jgi:HEAT repeat protein
MEALAGFHHPDVTQTLIELLRASDPDIVQFAAVLAGQNGDGNLVAPLSQLLRQPSASIRYSAVKGLIEMDQATARETLRKHLGMETDPEVLKLIASASLGANG